MAIKKSKIVSRIPKERVLEEAKLDLKTISTLTGKIGVTFSSNDEVPLHDAVKKMQNNHGTTSKLSDKENKRVQEIERIKNKAGTINNKVVKLESRKKAFVNTRKLSHELEIEEKRKRSQQSNNKSLSQLPDFMKLNQEIAQTYLQETTNKQKIKDNSKTLKTRNTKKTEVMDFFDTSESKKFSFKQSTNIKPSARNTNFLTKLDYVSESSKYFAQELGWIENEKPKRIFNSPLKEYKIEDEEGNEELIAEQVEENQLRTIDNLNDTLDLERAQAQEEMDLKTIDALAKKFAREAEEIKKNNDKLEQEFINVSDIYKKILDQSPISKISRTSKQVVKVPDGVDINKIPSFVLEGKK
ncbi:hypothetical protein [Spiroplasma culicicola]|uniref:Uncharacterized protein n=1 Tax=Spiroplasma culicicola AES-1 TaxID=1276246 RepID=W6A6W8_9MOLU|nr:hypothetical protein [Spiroplasma culicicola]AHI52722.1 hypothetical protein SCULI_v1c03810 [Spiroplasma culicicola AES-1]